jgi:hypothetical protein
MFVAEERPLLLLIQFTLTLFLFLLILNNAEEIVTLSLSLLSHISLFITELHKTSVLEVLLSASGLLPVRNLLDAKLTVVRLTSALSPKLINLALTIVSFFLQVTKTLKVFFFLGSYTDGFLDLTPFDKVLLSLVLDDLLLQLFLFISAVALDLNALSVTSLDLFHQFLYAFSFNDFLASFNVFVILDVS